MVMVGFNRRFSPHTVKIKELLAGRTEPPAMTMTVNAGFIPPEHWTQDPERGGGRPALIPFDEIVNATRASFATVESARNGTIIKLA